MGRSNKEETVGPAGLDEARPRETRRVERHFTKRILAGFLLLAPLLITLWIGLFVFTTIDDLFRGLS